MIIIGLIENGLLRSKKKLRRLRNTLHRMSGAQWWSCVKCWRFFSVTPDLLFCPDCIARMDSE